MSADDQVAKFFSQYPIIGHARGKLLILAGDSVKDVIYVESGRIDQYDIGSSGDKVIVNTFGSGAFLPMSNVLNDSPSEYFFEAASTGVEVRLAPIAEILAFLDENPEVVMDLLARVYRGVDGLLMRLSAQMSGTASDRIWRQLVIHGRRFGVESDADGSLSIKMTENQLAQQTGLARETVSRELKKLRRAGLVGQARQGQITFKPD